MFEKQVLMLNMCYSKKFILIVLAKTSVLKGVTEVRLHTRPSKNGLKRFKNSTSSKGVCDCEAYVTCKGVRLLRLRRRLCLTDYYVAFLKNQDI